MFNLAAFVHPMGKPSGGQGQTGAPSLSSLCSLLSALSFIGEIFYEDDEVKQPADHSASCFYITNAYNTIVGLLDSFMGALSVS